METKRFQKETINLGFVSGITFVRFNCRVVKDVSIAKKLLCLAPSTLYLALSSHCTKFVEMMPTRRIVLRFSIVFVAELV